MAEVIYINKKVNKDLKNIEIEMNKMLNKMNNLFNKQVKSIEDQILEIEDKIDEIEQKLWPDYFYIEAVNNNTIVRPEIEGTGYLKYTKTPDNDSSWTNIGSLEDINLNADEKVYFHGDLTPAQESGGGDIYAVKFHATGYIRCGGNVYYVADEDGKLTKSYQCAHLFDGCNYLMNAPELPATTLAPCCYYCMFTHTSVTTAPALPATTLADECYYRMFDGTGLTTAPELPATTLANWCYYRMFADTSLTTAPELPATTLTPHCYRGMFSGCENLTTAPELPATTLADYCYAGIFSGCLSLTTAPSILPATTLADNCYDSMFFTTSITTAPELPATTLVDYSYSEMFNGCQYLNYVKCLATDITASRSTFNWLQGVATTGTFVKDANTTWPTGVSGIPAGWTIINA